MHPRAVLHTGGHHEVKYLLRGPAQVYPSGQMSECSHDGILALEENLRRHGLQYVARRWATSDNHASQHSGNAVEEAVSAAAELDAVHGHRGTNGRPNSCNAAGSASWTQVIARRRGTARSRRSTPARRTRRTGGRMQSTALSTERRPSVLGARTAPDGQRVHRLPSLAQSPALGAAAAPAPRYSPSAAASSAGAAQTGSSLAPPRRRRRSTCLHPAAAALAAVSSRAFAEAHCGPPRGARAAAKLSRAAGVWQGG
eukprot:1264068-Pyramimonas_sp.AAC.1